MLKVIKIKNFFNVNMRREVTQANINYYAAPFTHPKRKMCDHDFIYVLQGKWKIGQNGKEYNLQKDSLLILGANQYHYGISPCQPNTKTMYFHVTADKDDCTKADDIPLPFMQMIPNLIDASSNRNIKKIFHEIVNAKLLGNDRKAAVYFDLLLCELADPEQHSKTARPAEQIMDIIHKNPERFFSNTELANRVGVSVKTAETKFKALYSVTIHQYILQFKAEQAMHLLKTFPEMSVQSVADNLGFYDEFHFSKQFKKITGVSPTEYKKHQLC